MAWPWPGVQGARRAARGRGATGPAWGTVGAMSRTLVFTAYALFALGLLAALSTPLVLGTPRPAVLGLPFPLAWTVGGVLCAFVATLALHLLAGGEEEG